MGDGLLDEEEAQDERHSPEETAPVDESGATESLWGRRASLGGDLRQGLEERRSGKRWMEAIHTAGGWRMEMR
jgi:hypothetical protein